MLEFAVLLLGAAVGFGVARWLNLPVIPVLLVAGVALSLTGTVPDSELLRDTLMLGLTVLVFVAGVELNPQRVGRQRRAALRVGFTQFFLLGVLGLGASLALGFALAESMYLALAITASSTLVVIRLLQQRQQLFEPFGRLVLGVLLLQDLLVILLIPVITRAPEGLTASLIGLLAALFLMGVAWVFLRWVTPAFITRIEPDEETLLLTTLALLFGFLGLAHLLGLPLAAGAFLAGVALSPFPVSGVLRAQLNSLSDFFVAIFFTALGGLLVIPSWNGLLQAAVLAALVVLATPPLVTVVAERAGLSARPAIESGLLLAQTSEFSLIVALQALALGHVDPEIFTIIALVTVITMVLTPFVATNRVTWRLMALHPLRQRTSLRERPRDHVLLLGCGDNGLPLLETLIAAGNEVLVVDDDPAVIEYLQEGDIPCIRGDGADFEVLETANAAEAKVIVSTMRRVRDNLSMLRAVRGAPALIRVFDPVDAARIEEAGGTPVVYSQAAAADLLHWLDQAERVGVRNERRTRPRD